MTEPHDWIIDPPSKYEKLQDACVVPFAFLLGGLGVSIALFGQARIDKRWEVYFEEHSCVAVSTAPKPYSGEMVTCHECSPGPKGTHVCR